MGFVSGISWGFGYFGAIACLMLALIVFIQAKEPPFGLLWDDAGPVRATMILAGIWLFIFSIPAFLFIKEEKTDIEKVNSYEQLVKKLKKWEVSPQETWDLIQKIKFNTIWFSRNNTCCSGSF